MRRALNPPLTLGEIVASLGGELQGEPSQPVDRLTSLRSADERSISFLVRPQQRDAALAVADVAAEADATGHDPRLQPGRGESAGHQLGSLRPELLTMPAGFVAEQVTFSGPLTDADLTELHAVINYVLASRRVPIVKVNLQTLKAYACRGQASKDDMVAAAGTHLGRFVQVFNAAYAMGEGVGNWDGHRTLKSQYDVHGPVLVRALRLASAL